jgi:hypothetical protein
MYYLITDDATEDELLQAAAEQRAMREQAREGNRSLAGWARIIELSGQQAQQRNA